MVKRNVKNRNRKTKTLGGKEALRRKGQSFANRNQIPTDPSTGLPIIGFYEDVKVPDSPTVNELGSLYDLGISGEVKYGDC